jgi:CSLREA domain-containing protein
MRILEKFWLLGLLLTCSSAYSATSTWSGGKGGAGAFSDSANWLGGVVPQPGDDLIFPGIVLNKTVSAMSGNFSSITIQGEYSFPGAGATTLSSANPIVYDCNCSGPFIGELSGAITLTNPDALALIRESGHFELAGAGSTIDFSGNVRFLGSATGALEIYPRLASTGQAGTVTYESNGLDTTTYFFTSPSNYTGDTFLVGPITGNSMQILIDSVAPFGDAGSATTLLDVSNSDLRVQNVIAAPKVIARERLRARNGTRLFAQLKGAGTGSTVEWSGPIELAESTLTLGLNDRDGLLRASGVISGTGNINVQNPLFVELSVVELSGNNSFDGNVSIRTDARLRTIGSERIPDTAVVDIAAAAAWTADGAIETIGMLSGDGIVRQQNGGLLTLAGPSSQTFNGSLQLTGVGSASLRITGGQLNFGGNYAISGPVRVEGGEFALSSDIADVQMQSGRLTLRSTASMDSISPALPGVGGEIVVEPLAEAELSNGTNAQATFNPATSVVFLVASDGLGSLSAIDTNGAISLGGATLNLAINPLDLPAVNVPFEIIRAPSKRLFGFFSGLLNGDEFFASGTRWRINYVTSAMSSSVVITRLATLTVDTLSDTTAGPSQCSLRDAIEAINIASAVDGCPSGSPGDVILFDASFASFQNATITLDAGPLLITKSMEIRGLSARILTIDANSQGRVFVVDDGIPDPNITVLISGLRLANGRASYDAGSQMSAGGAILNQEDLTLASVELVGNRATASLANADLALGGAVASMPGSTLNFFDSLAVNNIAESTAAGVSAKGGALYLAGNTSVFNSILFDNQANVGGAGAGAVPVSRGGAIYAEEILEMDFSTVFENRTSAVQITAANFDAAGGGIAAGASSDVLIRNSVLADNIAFSNVPARATGADFYNDGLTNAVFGYSSLGAGTVVGPTSITNAVVGDPKLQPLFRAGGELDVISFRPDSALRNAADPAQSDILTDIRGPDYPRTVAGRADVGAYELQFEISPLTIPNASVGIAYSQTLSASGGTAPYTFIDTLGPFDLSISPAGVLAGSFAMAGNFTIPILVRDSAVPPRESVIFYNISVGAGVPILSVADTAITDDQIGNPHLNFVASLSAPALSDVTFTVNTSTSDAEASDFTALTNASYTILMGQSSVNVLVPISADDIVELAETVQVTVSNLTNANAGDLIADGVINSTDTATIVINEISQLEGNSATTPMNFVVSMSAPVESAVRVDVATTSGSALAPSDFVAVNVNNLAIGPGAPGQSTGPVTTAVPVSIIGDTVIEPNESFTIALSSLNLTVPGLSSLVNIGVAAGTGTILNDDTANFTVVTSNILPQVFNPGATFTASAVVSDLNGSRPSGGLRFTATRAGLPVVPPLSCMVPVSNGALANQSVGSCVLNPTSPGNWITVATFESKAPLTMQNAAPVSALLTASLAAATVNQSANPTVVGEVFQVNLSFAAVANGPQPDGTLTLTQIPGSTSTIVPVVAGQAVVNVASRSAVVKTLLISFNDASGAYQFPDQFIAHTTLPANTALAASAPSSGDLGAVVPVAYTLSVLAPGAIPLSPGAPPGGMIEVSDGEVANRCALAGLSGTCGLTPISAGLRRISARYLGDSSFNASSAPPLSYNVGQTGGSTDLSVSLSNGVRVINSNQTTYTMLVRNSGADGVGGAQVSVNVPEGVSTMSFNCFAGFASNCLGANGTGAIARNVDIGPNSSVSFLIELTLPAGEQILSVTGAVAAPVGLTDVDLRNNSATDTDPRGLFGEGFESDGD